MVIWKKPPRPGFVSPSQCESDFSHETLGPSPLIPIQGKIIRSDNWCHLTDPFLDFMWSLNACHWAVCDSVHKSQCNFPSFQFSLDCPFDHAWRQCFHSWNCASPMATTLILTPVMNMLNALWPSPLWLHTWHEDMPNVDLVHVQNSRLDGTVRGGKAECHSAKWQCKVFHVLSNESVFLLHHSASHIFFHSWNCNLDKAEKQICGATACWFCIWLFHDVCVAFHAANLEISSAHCLLESQMFSCILASPWMLCLHHLLFWTNPSSCKRDLQQGCHAFFVCCFAFPTKVCSQIFCDTFLWWWNFHETVAKLFFS